MTAFTISISSWNPRSNVEYKANEAGTSVAFVQEGELWSYNTVENTLAKVFSFRGYEGIDSRENYGEHDIKIVGVDEVGSVDISRTVT